MGRIRRNYYKQVVYHVYNRGNNKEEILKEGEDKKIFLEIVGKALSDSHLTNLKRNLKI